MSICIEIYVMIWTDENLQVQEGPIWFILRSLRFRLSCQGHDDDHWQRCRPLIRAFWRQALHQKCWTGQSFSTGQSGISLPKLLVKMAEPGSQSSLIFIEIQLNEHSQLPRSVWRKPLGSRREMACHARAMPLALRRWTNAIRKRSKKECRAAEFSNFAVENPVKVRNWQFSEG